MLMLIAVAGVLIVFACAYGAADPAGLLTLVGRVADRRGDRHRLRVVPGSTGRVAKYAAHGELTWSRRLPAVLAFLFRA